MGITLREHTEKVNPPRALGAYPYGRPLGAPDDLRLQHEMIAPRSICMRRPPGRAMAEFPEQGSRRPRPISES